MCDRAAPRSSSAMRVPAALTDVNNGPLRDVKSPSSNSRNRNNKHRLAALLWTVAPRMLRCCRSANVRMNE
jgi:hypothetical protein